MKSFVRSDAVVLKLHFERKLVELEEEKKTLQVFMIFQFRSCLLC